MIKPPIASSGEIQIAPSVTAGMAYDNNAFLRSKQAGQKVSGDLIFSLTPQISLTNEGKRVTYKVNYGLTGTYYSFHPETNSVSHDANAGIEAMVTKQTSLAVRDYFKYTKESIGAISMGIRTTQRTVLYNDVSLSINHEFTTRTSASILLANNIMKYDSPLFIDTQTDSIGGEFNFKASEMTSFFVSYDYTTFSFTSNSATPPIHNHSAGIGFARHLSPTMVMNLTAGALYRIGASDTGATAQDQSQLDWTGHFDFTKTFTSSSMNIGYTRDISTTSGLTDSEGITERYMLRYNFPISVMSSMDIFGEYTNHYSKPSTMVNIKSINAGFNLRRRINKWLTMSAGYNHFQQFSEALIGNDINSDRVSLSLTAVPDMWRF